MEPVTVEPVTMTERPAQLEEPLVSDSQTDAQPESITEEQLMRIALDSAVEAIRPAIQMDGGDMIVLELRAEEGVVDIELTGACVGCPMSSVTLKQGVERILTDRVPGLSRVRAKGIDFDIVEDDW